RPGSAQMGEARWAGCFFRKLVQTLAQNAVLSAQCVHQFPAAPARCQVVSQAARLLRRQFAVDREGASLFRITFHDHLLLGASLRRNSCLARNNKAATWFLSSPNCCAISS